MKYYESLLEKGSFTREQLVKLVEKPSIANNIIYEYQKKGLIEQVKRDYYAVISLETKQPILSRYELGSNMFKDACISHHSALEVRGYENQVFYECFVATKKRFLDFEYNGVVYKRVERKDDLNVVIENGIKLTSLEQTVVDCIQDFEKKSGIEEIVRCLMLIPGLNEKKILDCLKSKNNGFLYQKCGYIFEELNDEFHFSNHFFDECEKHSSKAKRYLIKNLEDSIYQKRWNLYTPHFLKILIDKGIEDYDAIG